MFIKHPDPFEPQARFHGLSKIDFDTLARYNAEKAHGIMHTDAWKAHMAELQHKFNSFYRKGEEK